MKLFKLGLGILHSKVEIMENLKFGFWFLYAPFQTPNPGHSDHLELQKEAAPARPRDLLVATGRCVGCECGDSRCPGPCFCKHSRDIYKAARPCASSCARSDQLPAQALFHKRGKHDREDLSCALLYVGPVKQSLSVNKLLITFM
jgi:hypothetical protein